MCLPLPAQALILTEQLQWSCDPICGKSKTEIAAFLRIASILLPLLGQRPWASGPMKEEWLLLCLLPMMRMRVCVCLNTRLCGSNPQLNFCIGFPSQYLSFALLLFF